MSIFESMPMFLGVYIPLVLFGFFGIIFEERIAEAEQRLFKKIKRALRARKRKAVKKSKKEWSRQYGR